MAAKPPVTKRRRLLRRTALTATGFLILAALGLWIALRPGPVYRPGEAVEGLTADLHRAVPPDHPRVTFTDVTDQSGIGFKHFSGARSSQLPEDMGSGAAWGDFDNDGWMDLFVVNSVGSLSLTPDDRARSPARSRLYRNNGDGTFTDVTTQAGIDHRTWGMAAAWGDYDNDGWLDLVVTAYGENVLYRNNGGLTFTETGGTSGIGGRIGFWAGAAWGDYDRDGALDLYVVGYVRFAERPLEARSMHGEVEEPASLNPSSFPPERNLLFHNSGDGTFTEVAEQLGVADSVGRGMEAAWVDFDEDGWQDLYVANDVSDNVLYHNRGDGRFLNVSHEARVADYRGAMGLAIGDWDGDLDQDMVVTHWIAQENALYDNLLSQLRLADPEVRTPPKFTDEADRYGLGQIALDYIGWGTSFIDYDNDGRLDLFIVNGSTFQDRVDPTRLIPMRDQVFWNRGADRGFFDVSPVSGAYFDQEEVGRGAAFADYDNDGDVDVFVVNNGGRAVLLRNDGGNTNSWVQVSLRGTKSNHRGIGARVRVVAGGVAQIREVGVQSSYLSQNSPIEHFGLEESTVIDTLEVRWPSGLVDILHGAAANQRVRVVEGTAPPPPPPPPQAQSEGLTRDEISQFWVRYRTATRHRTAGDVRAAATEYERALQLNPDHEDALYNLGNMQMRLADFGGALGAWRRLSLVNPQSARAHTQLGRLFLCLDREAPFDPREAAAEFTRAHEINKEETGPLLHLGEAALLGEELGGASEYFEDVLASNPRSALALFYTGYISWKQSDSKRAGEVFKEAIQSLHGRRAEGTGSREGDTKSGRAMLSADDCSRLSDVMRSLIEIPEEEALSRMRESYMTLDSRVTAARGRRPR